MEERKPSPEYEQAKIERDPPLRAKPWHPKPWKPRRYTDRFHRPQHRGLVFSRDLGVCALCGLNTMDLGAALVYVQEKCDSGDWPMNFVLFKRAIGRNASQFHRLVMWQVDRIQPRTNGGKDELSNYRTLCLECHRKETNRVIYGSVAQ